MIFLRMAGLLVATGFCGSAALALRRALRLEEGSAGLLVFLLLFSALQSVLILAAGLAGLLSLAPLSLATALGWALLQLRKPRLRILLALPQGPAEKTVLAMAVLGLLSLLIKAFLLEPHTGDALMYHLPKIAEWVQAGRFVWGVNHDPRVWFSSGFELIETWWVVFLHHDLLIELGGIQMMLIAGLAVATLAESLGAKPGIAAVLYGFMPAALLNATSCGNDLAVAALVLSAYALVAAGLPRPLQAFPLLLALGVKATAGFAALGVLLYAFLLRDRPASKLQPWGAWALTGTGLLLGGFWYARNLLVAGHVLYPFHGQHGEFTWLPQQAAFDVESLQATLQVLPRRVVDPQVFGAAGRNIAGWGWALVPLGLPALMLALREDRRYRLLALSFVLGAGVTLCFVWMDDANLRFVLWFPALLALALARQQGRLWIAAALSACLLNFGSTLIPHEIRHAEHLRAPAGLPPDAPIACIFDQAVPSYRLYQPDFSRRVFYPRSMDDLRRSGAKCAYLYDELEWAAPIRTWRSLGGRFHEVP